MSTTEPTRKGKLLTEFAPVSYDDWRRLVQSELKDVPFEKKMVSTGYEGIPIAGLYQKSDLEGLSHVHSLPGFAPYVRGCKASGYVDGPWEVSQEIAFPSPTEFNNAARNSVSRGLNALNMVLDQATRNGHDPDWALPEQVGYGGLSIATLSDLDRALDGVDLEKTSLLVRSGASAMPFGALLAALARKRKKSLAKLKGCIEMDPLAVLAHEGRLPQSMEGAYREMAALTRWAAEQAPQLQTICVHSRAWHEAGGNAVQELAFVLAMGVEYLRAMDARGLAVDVAGPRLRFAMTVGVNFFTEIAKLRALRMLWSRAVAAAGGGEEAQRCWIHARTCHWNKTVFDPYNNMLRTTVEAFAGVLGACDSLQVGAFDEVFRKPDDFSQRIARNTQLILQKECHLDHVIDPAGGSYYVERLTAELAQRAWGLFQEVEKLGGMEAALRAGFPQQQVATTAAERLKNVGRRRDSIIGINQYANPREKRLEHPAVDTHAFHKRRVQQVASHRTGLEDDESELVLEKLAAVINKKEAALFEACVEAVGAGATLGEITRAVRISDSPCPPVKRVEITRAAARVERLREAADAYAARHGQPPQAFLCNMGPLKEHKARADFSRSFLAMGGIDAVSPPGFKSVEEAAKAFGASGCQLAVVCSTDDKYPELVPALVGALRAVNPKILIVLAGYPADQVEAHKQAGVDEFIHLRADALEVLKNIHTRLGIA